MANVTVSSTSALNSALKSAANGDVITLAAGHYNLETKSLSKSVTITSNGSATIDSMSLVKTNNLTIDGVNFDGRDGDTKSFEIRASSNITIRDGDMQGVASGYGQGRGLWIGASNNVTVENMSIHGFQTGVFVSGTSGLVFQDNTLTNISLDGITSGGVHGATYARNVIDINLPNGVKHSDGFQFWNTGKNPATDVVLEGNVIRTHNSQSHGIFFGNAVANKGGGPASFFQDVTIKENVIVGGDGFGIFWGQTKGLDITRNILLWDKDLPSQKGIPHIRVNYASSDVDISGNVVSKASIPATNTWKDMSPSSVSWTISDKMIPAGSTLADAQILLNSIASKAAALALAAPQAALAGTFSFDAMGKADVVAGIDFGKGDRIDLHDFAAGTFKGAVADAGGASATIGSLDELRDLDRASKAVSVHQGDGDTLVIDIHQPGPDHLIKLVDMAHAYL